MVTTVGLWSVPFEIQVNDSNDGGSPTVQSAPPSALTSCLAPKRRPLLSPGSLFRRSGDSIQREGLVAHHVVRDGPRGHVASKLLAGGNVEPVVNPQVHP